MSAELVQFPHHQLTPQAGPQQQGYGQHGPMPNDALIHVHLQAMRAERKAELTVKRRGEELRRLADYLAPTLLLEARYPQLLAWQTSMPDLGAATVAVYVSGIRVFYQWCVRPMRLLTESPAEDLVLPRVPARKPRPIPEQHLQIAVTCTPDPMLRAWLYLGAYAGLRCCEISALQRGWIIEGETPRLHIIGKGQKERVVFIGPQILRVLEPFMDRPSHLFLSSVGRPIPANEVSRRINHHFRAVGMPYTAHQLRHRYGTRALELTKNIRVVQEQMGHSSPTTTAGYTQVNEDETAALAKALDAEAKDGRPDQPAASPSRSRRPAPAPQQAPQAQGFSLAAGWYADPEGTPTVRWWDGQQWTQAIAPLPDSP